MKTATHPDGVDPVAGFAVGLPPRRLGRRDWGIHSSHLGRYQFQSPSTFIEAGSSTPRTIVASINTAAARPTPISLKSMNVSVMKTANTTTITIAALVTVPPVVAI